MAYQIEAFIKDGVPTLNIWDYSKHELCMSWTYDKEGENGSTRPNHEIQSLFRKLLLLTLKDDISNVRVFELNSID